MKPKVHMTLGGPDEFFKIASEHAAKLDRDEPLPDEVRILFEDPADLARALSPERVRVLQAVRQAKGKTQHTVTSIAVKLERDRKAVDRDVTLLTSLGLLKVSRRTNPGHGVVKVVEPIAKTYHLSATL